MCIDHFLSLHFLHDSATSASLIVVAARTSSLRTHLIFNLISLIGVNWTASQFLITHLIVNSLPYGIPRLACWQRGGNSLSIATKFCFPLGTLKLGTIKAGFSSIRMNRSINEVTPKEMKLESIIFLTCSRRFLNPNYVLFVTIGTLITLLCTVAVHSKSLGS